MNSRFRILIQIISMLFPWAIRRQILVRLLKYRISPGAYVGYSIILSKTVVLHDGSRIGSLTFIKGINKLEIGPSGRLGSLNWVTGFPAENRSYFYDQPERNPSLSIGVNASITARHYIDCTDSVTIGDFSVFGGWQSQILTHSLDIKDGRQRSAPVVIGDYCFVGTRTVVLKNSIIPDRSVLAAGSIYNLRETRPLGLYSGVPASRVKELNPKNVFFNRKLDHRD